MIEETTTDSTSVSNLSSEGEREALLLKEVFGLFACTRRCQVFSLLLEHRGTLYVNQIAEKMQVSQQLVSYHLAHLREKGLVCAKAHGAYRFYRVQLDKFHDASARLFVTKGSLFSQEGELQ